MRNIFSSFLSAAGARLHIRWLNSEKSREDFGYGATVLYYEKLLRRCHPNNRPRMEALLAEARRGEGETLFEKLTALIARTDTGHDCTLSLEYAIKKKRPAARAFVRRVLCCIRKDC